jgi:monoamine oxidase
LRSLHWAGTETADVSMGYYDGAIQSGKRVADNCIKHLSA